MSFPVWWALTLALVASPAVAFERLGVALDALAENGQLSGEQWIDASRIDESFDYTGAALSGSAWLLFKSGDRLRWGPGARIHGSYAYPNEYDFGFLSEAFLLADYSLPIFAQWFLTLGGRAGMQVLVPGGDLGREISRLQSDGVGVWSVPRVGWLAGVSVGVRRQLIGRLHLKFDFTGQVGQLFLFATDERVEELRFRKYWNTWSQRLSATLGLELTL